MMEETFLMEHIKESACFVSQDLKADLAIAKKGGYRMEYVLPDGVSNGSGYLRKPLSREETKEAAKQGKEVQDYLWTSKSTFVPAFSQNLTLYPTLSKGAPCCHLCAMSLKRPLS